MKIALKLRQRRTAGNGNIGAKMSILSLSVVDRCRNRPGTVSSSSAWSKPPDLPLQFRYYPIRHGSRDINISSLAATLPFPVIDRYRNHLAPLLSSSPWPKMPDLPLEFRRCHNSRDISISGFGGHITISGCRLLLQSLPRLSPSAPRSKISSSLLEFWWYLSYLRIYK